MGKTSQIQWTDATWNIARGCTKVDEDCKFCYMYRQSLNNTRYNPMQVVKTKTVFNLPLKLKEPSKIFTCSLTDFFHEECDNFRNEAWDIIRQCPQHIFQILTKRPERIAGNLPEYWDEIKDRCWIGASVGSREGIQRMITLSNIGRLGLKFLSLEPLHGEIDFRPYASNFNEFDWIIVGGESGNDVGKYRYRECKLEWIEKIVYQCKGAGVPVFVKQLGTHLAKQLNLSDRHGGNIDEFPEHLKIREFPNYKHGKS